MSNSKWKRSPDGRTRRRRKAKGPRFAQVFWFVIDSSAWRSLSGIQAKAYVEVVRLYDGLNNGKLEASARWLAGRIGVSSPNAAASALRTLVKKGFLEVVRESAFNMKTAEGKGREYRLTTYPCDVTGKAALWTAQSGPPKDFSRSSYEDGESSQEDNTKQSTPGVESSQEDNRGQSRVLVGGQYLDIPLPTAQSTAPHLGGSEPQRGTTTVGPAPPLTDPASKVVMLPMRDIYIPHDRTADLDGGKIADLIKTYGDVEWPPITVKRSRHYRSGILCDAWAVVDGRHRYRAAYDLMDIDTIASVIVEEADIPKDVFCPRHRHRRPRPPNGKDAA